MRRPSLRARLQTAHEALSLPGWTEQPPMDHIRVWTVTEPRMVSVVARCEDRWIRVSTSVGGRIGYATVTAPEFAQPVLDAVAMVAGRAV